MAESPAHKFGQVIGSLLESVVQPPLAHFCERHSLYLDYQSQKRAVRRGRKVSWEDPYGNRHDLDFVIERGGSDHKLGQPVGFIEVAWRRYTKHSRNKAQEIQGAILPLAERYKWNNPFFGVVLAGEFTSTSLEQPRSLGFHVLYFPYITLVAAFAAVGIDIRFDEDTQDEEFRRVANLIIGSSDEMKQQIREHLIKSNATQIATFFAALDARFGRSIQQVLIIPLYGRINEFVTLDSALQFLDTHPIYEGSGEFRKYEVMVEFSDGDKVDAFFKTKQNFREFLNLIAMQ
jgi:hypothetical protein